MRQNASLRVSNCQLSGPMLVVSMCVPKFCHFLQRKYNFVRSFYRYPFHYKKNVVFVKIPLRVVNAVRIVDPPFLQTINSNGQTENGQWRLEGESGKKMKLDKKVNFRN